MLLIAASLVLVAAHAAPQATPAPQRDDARRVALIIGNDAYQSVPPLARAANDAKAMAAALKKIGFATTLLTNATQKRMNKAINEFAEGIAGGGVGVMFFAGHGVQIDNQNFLLPVDIEEPQRDSDVQDQAVSLQAIQEKLALVRARFALMVIDACRDNPLPRKAGRSIGGTRGLSQPTAPNGQMIIFSAGANETALDSLSPTDRDPNGLFTREFLPVLSRPGLSVSDALKAVKKGVIAKAGSVNHDQHPAVYDQTDGDFYLVPGTPNAGSSATSEPDHAPSTARQEATPAGPAGQDEEETLWAQIKDSKRQSDFEAYLVKFPSGRYVEAAKVAVHGIGLVADSKTGCKMWTGWTRASLTWTGGCVDGLAEGSGTFEFIDGERKVAGQKTEKAGHNIGPISQKVYKNGQLTHSWEGEMIRTKEGRLIFSGTIVHESSDDRIASETGKFMNEFLFDGKLTFRDGSERTCQFAEDGKSTGFCHLKGKDGYTYDGDFKDGHQTGHAKIHTGKLDYEGSVKDGAPDGYGKAAFSNGDTYEGDIQSGKNNGKGVYVSKNGCRYVGDFVDGKRHGQGLYTCPNGTRQEGRFIAGVYSGR
jgi:hypothetical protein